jgi:hypothetical protein
LRPESLTRETLAEAMIPMAAIAALSLSDSGAKPV